MNNLVSNSKEMLDSSKVVSSKWEWDKSCYRPKS
jgi:hypothetical protein